MLKEIISALEILERFSIQNLLALIILVLLGLILYYLKVTHKNAKQANNAVNHKGKDEPTLRKLVLDLRETQLNQADKELERFDKVEIKLERVNDRLDKHGDRLNKLEQHGKSI